MLCGLILGLRLMMGEFPVERALEHLIKESAHGWRRLNCDRLFPRYTTININQSNFISLLRKKNTRT
ncbi:Uncharacterized protein FWK35_00026310 [Aphis craccivora]|uniref:Uncharacterized protein n=1 Tax=Aphis craccivora TaxID=307492 RepID=A0A6G0Z974_APHCR|nr:Uncharacterized protein FWK35_00026310 [Aphis craccivora]